MDNTDKFIDMLQSSSSSRRYEACEELRVSPAHTPEVVAALTQALNDPAREVAEAAQRALEAKDEQIREGQEQVASQTPGALVSEQVVRQAPPVPAESSEYVAWLEQRVQALETDVQRMNGRLQEARDQVTTLNSRVLNNKLLSPNFLTRAFTAYGYILVAGLMIAIPFWCLTMALTTLIGISGN